MLSFLLAKKIASMFLMMFTGILLVKAKCLKMADSKVISAISVYICCPCMLISSFQIDYSPEVRNGFLLALAGAAVIHAVFLITGIFLRRSIHLEPVEEASLIFPNSGNLIIPIVASVMGPEYVIYSSAFLAMQDFFIFSYGISLIKGAGAIDWKKMFKNLNIMAIVVGVVMFFGDLSFPDILQDAVDSLGNMMGPLSMIVTGMLIGTMDLKEVFTYRRTLLISFLKLLALPLVVAVLFVLSGLAGLMPNGKLLLMIPFLAACAPPASLVTQLSQVYGGDSVYASSMNIVATLCCIITIPAMAWVFEIL